MERVILAVDIGGSKYVAGLIDWQGKVLYRRKYRWNSFSVEKVITDLISAMEAVIKIAKEKIIAVGMTIPGLADSDQGIWLSSSFMGIYNLPIGSIICEHFGLPVYIENDCNACALAERMFGRCRQIENFLYLTVSNSIGGAIVINGEVYPGAFGCAGEVGLIPVDIDDFLSESKSYRIALEDCASGRGLVNAYLRLGGKRKIDGVCPDGVNITRLARSGDEVAIRALYKEGRYLGRAIAACSLILNPEMVIIGGGLSLAFDQFGDVLRNTVKKEMEVSGTNCPMIEVTSLGYDGGLIGAAAVAKRAISI